MIDGNAPTALYFQLKEVLIHKILNGEWESDSLIPSERELCGLYEVSRITVRKALDDLTQSGYLSRKQGKGTYVKSALIEQKLSRFYSFSEEMKSKGINETAEILDFAIEKADQIIAEKLGLCAGDALYRIKRRRAAGVDIYALEVSYIPFNTCPNLTKNLVLQKGLYNAIKENGIFPDKANEVFGAISIIGSNADLLGVSEGEAGISLKRTTYAQSKIIEYCVSVIRGDRFVYSVELK